MHVYVYVYCIHTLGHVISWLLVFFMSLHVMLDTAKLCWPNPGQCVVSVLFVVSA